MSTTHLPNLTITIPGELRTILAERVSRRDQIGRGQVASSDPVRLRLAADLLDGHLHDRVAPTRTDSHGSVVVDCVTGDGDEITIRPWDRRPGHDGPDVPTLAIGHTQSGSVFRAIHADLETARALHLALGNLIACYPSTDR